MSNSWRPRPSPRACGDCQHQLPQPRGVPPPGPQEPPTVSGVFALHALGGDFFFNSKPQLSQLLSNVALCSKGILPKSCSQDSLDLCPFAFQIITWVALPSNLDFSFLFLPAGDHQPAPCRSPQTPRFSIHTSTCPFRLLAHTQLRDNAHPIGCSDPQEGVSEVS